MDFSTLLSANVLLLSIFAISFLAMSLRVHPKGHWRSWAAANATLAIALLLQAIQAHLPLLTAYLLPNMLLLTGLGFHWHAARQLAGLPSGLSHILAPACAYAVAAFLSLPLGNFAPAAAVSNIIFALLCITTIGAYSSPPFRGLVSAIGLVLAFFLLAAEGTLRTVHGIFYGGPVTPGATSAVLEDTRQFAMLVFVSLTGAFSLAVSFEHTAHRHREAARRDPLTGTFNRREFQMRLDEIVSAAPEKAFCLIQFDLDFFKHVNDRYGHLAGDEALVKVSRAVKSHLRSDDCFARIGGEEFAVLLPDITLENAYKVAERLRNCIANQKYDFSPESFRITASFGVYHGKGGGLQPKDLVNIVDSRLYQSKSEGRNRVSIALPGDNFNFTGNSFGT